MLDSIPFEFFSMGAGEMDSISGSPPGHGLRRIFDGTFSAINNTNCPVANKHM